MKSTVIDTVTKRLPIAAQAMPVALSTSVVSKPPCSLPLRFVWMAGSMRRPTAALPQLML